MSYFLHQGIKLQRTGQPDIKENIKGMGRDFIHVQICLSFKLSDQS